MSVVRRVLLVAAIIAAVATATLVKDGARGVPTVRYCSEPDALLHDLKIHWSPDDVKPGEDVTLVLLGNLTQPVANMSVTASATVDGLIKLGPYTVDVCSLDKKVEVCPLKAGPIRLEHKLKVPSWLPAGSVEVNANLFRTDDHRQVACLNVTIAW